MPHGRVRRDSRHRRDVGNTLAAPSGCHGPTILAWTWLFIRLAGWIVLLHLIEITVWASFYVWTDAMPDLPSALYFSAVTYTTTGYGDLVLPQEWRLVGAVEALTGILMCGWSTGFFFVVVSRMVTAEASPVVNSKT